MIFPPLLKQLRFNRFNDSNRANHICTFDRSEDAVWLQAESSTDPDHHLASIFKHMNVRRSVLARRQIDVYPEPTDLMHLRHMVNLNQAVGFCNTHNCDGQYLQPQSLLPSQERRKKRRHE